MQAQEIVQAMRVASSTLYSNLSVVTEEGELPPGMFEEQIVEVKEVLGKDGVGMQARFV